MMKTLFGFIAFFAIVSMTGCETYYVLGERDVETGYLKISRNASVEIVENTPVDLDRYKSLLVIKNSDLVRSQVENLNYFEEIMNMSELEDEIIDNELTDKVPSLNQAIGLTNASNHYREFLVLEFKVIRFDQSHRVDTELSLYDPATAQYLFLAKTTVNVSFNDQQNVYPLYNKLIDYIEDNSQTYDRFESLDAE
ncbi:MULTISPECIES: hypothetical protein [Gammaproteobacteria]|uniref:hypothetical protein n=1 Tax=Gammaproteobacteria TaxID=1236 RepID=UPI000DCF95C1|nr:MULTISPECIES: hypothetical protein [Gammaproteobacteria]RTE85473.1 hypothetical protein DQX04_11245 [Aliidiomarina sp. B3213]TCZ89440.1 hypothetical protein EYQ95_11165 [Lysobacter sp. N42]